MDEQAAREVLSVTWAAERCGMPPRVVYHYIEWGLVQEPLRPDDVDRLRRIRRLSALGINMAGIEVILHMRRRIQALQAEVDRLREHSKP